MEVKDSAKDMVSRVHFRCCDRVMDLSSAMINGIYRLVSPEEFGFYKTSRAGDEMLLCV